MNRYGASLCALACFATLSLPCIAQDNPWNGSWKMDHSTLKYNGATYTITTAPDGYTITRSGKRDPKVVCDGKPNPVHEGTVTTCNKAGAGYELENTRDGKVVSKVKIEPSEDGQTVTRTATIKEPDGSQNTITLHDTRVSGGKGAPTVYKETGFEESADTGVLSIMVKGDSIDFKESDNEKPITCKLDGTPTKIGDRSMSVKQAGPRTLKVTYSADGKVQRENTFVLSPDGKTVKETDVTPAPSPSTMSVMFHKS